MFGSHFAVKDFSFVPTFTQTSNAKREIIDDTAGDSGESLKIKKKVSFEDENIEVIQTNFVDSLSELQAGLFNAVLLQRKQGKPNKKGNFIVNDSNPKFL